MMKIVIIHGLCPQAFPSLGASLWLLGEAGLAWEKQVAAPWMAVYLLRMV